MSPFAAATPASTAPIATIVSTTPVASIGVSLAPVDSLHISAHWCTSFDFAALLKGRFAREFHSPLVVDPDAFHPDHLANLRDVFSPVHSEISQLGNVDEAVFAREHFHESAEFFDRHDAPVIGLADLHFLRHATDDLLRAGHALAARRIDVNRAVVFDVNLRSGFSDDALDRFTARSNKGADLLGIDFDRLRSE